VGHINVKSLYENFLDEFKCTCSEFDIIALCYATLLELVHDDDVSFIYKVQNLSKDKKYGKVFIDFDEFRKRILKLAVNSKMRGNVNEFRDNIYSILEEYKCRFIRDDKNIFSFALFYIIESIDSYIELDINELFKTQKNFGPLNCNVSKQKCVVYYQERNSFLQASYAGFNSNNTNSTKCFRIPHRDTRIGSIFHTILIISCENLPKRIPQIVPIDMCGIGFSDRVNSKFRLASIPYLGFDSFEFCNFRSGQGFKSNDFFEGNFGVRYLESNEDEDIRRIKTLLKIAINNGANIVLFPEYIMSERMLQAVKNEIVSASSNDNNQLCLVLAGTSYEWVSDDSGDNILHILNGKASCQETVEIGRYYKFSPFIVRSEDIIHGVNAKKHADVKTKVDSKKYIEMCEVLQSPGNEITLIDIDVIGRILPAVCRDVIDGKITNQLAKLFYPSLIAVIAWSKSISSFDVGLSGFAETIHACSLLCNCCNAVDGENCMTIGKFIYPSKQETKMKSKNVEIQRSTGCKANCQNIDGCVRFIDVDYSDVELKIKEIAFCGNGLEYNITKG